MDALCIYLVGICLNKFRYQWGGLTLLLVPLTAALWHVQSSAAEFSAKVDTSFRFDDRSGRDARYQSRVRFFPSFTFDDAKQWSLNGFAVTGDDFSSSHNTLDDGEADLFYLRRVFLRYENAQGKTEVGVIPTYKGRVSSTGLAKDGWIQGIRHVRNVKDGKIELVLGSLDDTRASHALQGPNKLSYFELEYSGQITQQLSLEGSLERLLETNFASGEIRYQSSLDSTFAFEVISNIEDQGTKLVLSVERTFVMLAQQWELFSYYSYVDDNFGPREELTEDFLAIGHGIAFELTSSLGIDALDWFTKFEAYQGNSRVQLGVKYKFAF